MRKSVLATVALSVFAIPLCYGSPQQESVADAARKARAQKKNQPKAVRVITNDDVASGAGNINVLGTATPAAATDVKADVPADAAAKPATQEKGEAYWRKRFADAHEKLRAAEKELDILQRELNLQQRQHYPDPNEALLRQYDRKDINEKNQRIQEKQKEIQRLRQAISDLEDDLRRAGGNPGWAREP